MSAGKISSRIRFRGGRANRRKRARLERNSGHATGARKKFKA